jgi:hypothetical protein
MNKIKMRVEKYKKEMAGGAGKSFVHRLWAREVPRRALNTISSGLGTSNANPELIFIPGGAALR